MHTAGVILAGGGSRRMGAPKALLDWRGRSLLQHVVETVSSAVAPVVVSAAAGQPLPPLPAAVPVVVDPQPDQGPLAGYCSALAWLTAHHPHVSQVFVCGCDAPLLSAAVVRCVVGALAEADAAMPVIDGQRYPLIGVYRVTTLGLAEQLLAQGQRRFQSFVERLRVQPLDAAPLRQVDPALDCLLACNTPDHYAQALSRAGLPSEYNGGQTTRIF